MSTLAKTKTYRNPEYLRFIRHHCSVTTWDPPLQPWPEREDPLFDPESFGTVAAHVRIGNGGGMGLKPSDYRTVPLTDQEHREQHQVGERTWWRNLGVDPSQIIISLLCRYLNVPDDERIILLNDRDDLETIRNLEALAHEEYLGGDL